MRYSDSITVNITATDDPGNIITPSSNNFPPFAHLTDLGNGKGVISFIPNSSYVGQFNNLSISASNNRGGKTTRIFNLTVKDKYISSVYVNFTDGSPQANPWNNMNGYPYGSRSISNMIDETNSATSMNLTLMNQWTETYTFGQTTGNNSGIFPDNVMQYCYYLQDTATRYLQLSGLSSSKKYNIVFFGSMNFGINSTMHYTIGNQTVTLNPDYNTTKTVEINGISPDVNGDITMALQKDIAAKFGVLNAMVIESYTDSGEVLSPGNLTSTAISKSAITLNWQDRSNNETGFQIWRALSLNGPFTEIGTMAAGSTSYQDQGLTPNTRYFYEVRATGTSGFSDFSNVVGVTTFAQQVYINLTSPANLAGSPWNNTAGSPLAGTIFGNLQDELEKEKRLRDAHLRAMIRSFLSASSSRRRSSWIPPWRWNPYTTYSFFNFEVERRPSPSNSRRA